MRWLCAVAMLAVACSPVRLVEPKTGLTERAANVGALHAASAVAPEIVDEGLHLFVEQAFGDDTGRHAFQSGWSLELRDGRATAGPDGRVVLWRADGQARGSVRVGGRVLAGLLIHDGDTLVALGDEHELVAIDTTTAAERWRTKLPETHCHGVALLDGGTWLGNPSDATCDAGRLAWRVHAETGKRALAALYRAPVFVEEDEPDPVRAIAFDGDVTHVARLVVQDWTLVQSGCLVDHVPTRVELEVLEVDGARRILEPAPDDGARLWFGAGGRTLTAKSGNRAQTWSLETGRLVAEPGPEPAAPLAVGVAHGSSDQWDAVRVLAASRDGDRAAWASEGVVWLSAGERADPLLVLPKQRRFVDGLAFGPGGATLTIAHHVEVEATVEQWDLASQTRRHALRVGSPESRQVTLVGHDNVMFESTFERTHIFVNERLGIKQRIDSDGRSFDGASFTTDTKVMFASQYGTLHAWDRETGTSLRRIEVVGAHPHTWVSPDDRWMAYVVPQSGGDRQVKLWDISSRRVVGVLEERPREVTAGAFSSDGQLLALAGDDGWVHVHRIPDGRRVATLGFDVRHDIPTALAFSRAHLWVATARGVVFRLAHSPSALVRGSRAEERSARR